MTKGRWKPGESGNLKGRPPGARSRLGEVVLSALLQDFERFGAAAIVAVREDKPSAYLASIVSLIARDTGNQTAAEARAQAHAELAEAARKVNAMLGLPDQATGGYDPGADPDED